MFNRLCHDYDRNNGNRKVYIPLITYNSMKSGSKTAKMVKQYLALNPLKRSKIK